MTARRPSVGLRWRSWTFVLATLGAVMLVAVVVVALLTADARVVTPAEAAENVERETMRVRFDINAVSGGETYSVLGEGVLAGDGSGGRLSGTVTVGGEEPLVGDLLLAGEDAWVTSDQLRLPDGKRWLQVSDEIGSETFAPADLIRFLVDAEDVSEEGDQSVAGTPARWYRGRIDLGELGEKAGGGIEVRMEQALDGRDSELPIDIWLTEDGLPKRLLIELVAADEIRLEIEVLEYGVAVDAEAPPARSVLELEETGQQAAYRPAA